MQTKKVKIKILNSSTYNNFYNIFRKLYIYFLLVSQCLIEKFGLSECN